MIKKKKYNKVGKISNSNRLMVETELKSMFLTHICMTTHFLGLVQALQ